MLVRLRTQAYLSMMSIAKRNDIILHIRKQLKCYVNLRWKRRNTMTVIRMNAVLVILHGSILHFHVCENDAS